MATMNPYIPERRHAMDRRNHVASASSAALSGASRVNASGASMQRESARENSHVMNAVDWLSMVLLIVGGLNWGAVGLFGLDVVANLFGEGTAITRGIYVLVGLAALYSVYTASKMSRSHT